MTVRYPGLSKVNVSAHGNCFFPSLLSVLPSKAGEAWGQAGGFIGHALLGERYGPA